MRLLKRNLVPIWYCLYQGKAPLRDADGNETGESVTVYSNPTRLLCNVSPATGHAQIETFGNLESYDKVLMTADMNCPITENSVLFVDSAPSGTSEMGYDYVVRRIAKSLNYIAIAVSKVKVS